MNRIKKIFTLLHFGGWLLIFLLFCWILASEGHTDWFYKSGILISILVTIFYSHFFLLTYFLYRRKYIFYVLGLIFLLRVSPISFLWAYGIERKNWPLLGDQYFSFLVISLFCVVFSWIARAIEYRFINSLKKEKLQNQTMLAELNYLKSQINPHFLFNTLNNIHTLSYKSSPLAPDAIMRLATLMRYMIYEANAPTVALRREIDYLQDFISLQQLRYKVSPIVDFKIAGDIDSCQIAPLLFIHLLENAYKHSPTQLDANDIKVSLEIKENSLTFSIQNPMGRKKQESDQEAGGIGLVNVKKRLQLLYPGQHSFTVSSAEDFFKVVLKIDHLPIQNHEKKADLLYSR